MSLHKQGEKLRKVREGQALHSSRWPLHSILIALPMHPMKSAEASPAPAPW